MYIKMGQSSSIYVYVHAALFNYQNYLRNTETCNSEACKEIFPEFSCGVVSAPIKNRKYSLQNWKEECGAGLISERRKLFSTLRECFPHRICNNTPRTWGLRSVKHPLRPYIHYYWALLNVHLHMLAGLHVWRSHNEVFGRTSSREIWLYSHQTLLIKCWCYEFGGLNIGKGLI